MDIDHIIDILTGCVLGVVSWTVLREVRRIDALEKSQRNVVTQEQFQLRLNEMDAQRQLFHNENSKKLDEISLTMKALYQQAVDLGRIQERVRQLEERRDYIDDWKHEKVDPYIPRAVDELERRLTKLEAK